MATLIRRLVDTMSDQREPDIRARLFRGVTLTVSVVLLGPVTPANLVLRVTPWDHVSVIGLGTCSLVLFRRALEGDYAYVGLFVLVLVALDVAWLGSAGSMGSASMWLFAGVVDAVLFFRGRALRLALATFVLNGIGLLCMEQIAPDLFRAYSSAQSRFHDLVVSFVFSTTTIGTLWWIVLSAYQREQQRLHETVAELERRVAEVHTLRGLLPICAWCKRIRTDRGLWTEVERYLAGQPNVELTHALCPDCRTKNFPDLPPGEE